MNILFATAGIVGGTIALSAVLFAPSAKRIVELEEDIDGIHE